MSQELDLTSALQSRSFREIVAALDEVMQSRTVIQWIDDYHQLWQSMACPLCHCRADDSGIDHRLIVQIILDGFKCESNSVFISCDELEVSIAYDTTPQGHKSDVLPLRFWHLILSGLHQMFAKHQSSQDTAPDAASLNHLTISEIPDFDSLRLIAKKRNRIVPNGFRTWYSDRQVEIQFE